MTGDRWGHSGSRERGARQSGAIGKKIVRVARAITRPAAEKSAKVVQLPLPGLVPGGANSPKLPPRPRFLRRARRPRPEVNEPARPRLFRTSTSMSRGELYEWHERRGTLHLYFSMFPEP